MPQHHKYDHNAFDIVNLVISRNRFHNNDTSLQQVSQPGRKLLSPVHKKVLKENPAYFFQIPL